MEEIELNNNDIDIINKINTFFESKNINIKYNHKDLTALQTLIGIKDFLFEQIDEELQRKINKIFYTKNKLMSKYNINNNKYFLFIIFNYIYRKNVMPFFVNNFYKIDLISFHTIFLFLDFFLIINEENKQNINLYTQNIISIIKQMKKIIKITKIADKNKVKEKKEINSDINYLLKKIFSFNNKESVQNIRLIKNLIKYPKILSLLKLSNNYYFNDILDNNNKKFIRNNLEKMCLKNLNNEHSNYLFSLAKKYVKLNFNNNDNKIQDKKYYSFLTGISKFFNQLMFNENNNNDSLNKYFLFDYSEEDEKKLKTSSLNLNGEMDPNEINLSFIFSFKLFESDNNKNILLSVNNSENKKIILRLIIKKNNLYLYSYTNNNKQEFLLIETVENNINYLCYLYIGENHIHFHSNNGMKNVGTLKLKNVEKIYIEIGNITNNENKKNEQKFNVLIGPILIFNDKIFNPSNILQKISDKSLQGKYFLLAEMFNEDIDNKEKENFYFYYDSFYRILDNKNEIIKILNEVKKDLKNLILYINPEVISNNFNFRYGNNYTYRDYQIYNDPFDIKNYTNSNKYEIIGEKNIDDIIMIQQSFGEFFVNNQILDYLILNIEIIYNEILISESYNISEEKFNLL